jgi:membrane protease YdiL (CAAX protease family)
MTARPGAAASLGAWVAPALLLAGLGVVVLARAWATRAGVDPIVVGAVFGIALALIAGAGSLRVAPRAMPVVRAMAIGLVFGLVLIGLTVSGASIGGGAIVPGLGRPAAAFLPWAADTVLVATAEEALLRGRLFDAVQRAGGMPAALVVTTLAFALMHVPLYGWHVVPLDLAVGIALGGLRLATGGIAAPAAAHVVADLATWWL